MKVFRVDPYQSCRSACFLLGFIAPVAPYALLVQGKTYSTKDLLLGGLAVFVTPLAILIYSKLEYLAIDGRQLIIARLFRKTVVQINQISSLSYEFTGMALMLFVHYETNGEKKWRGFVMDFMSTSNIKALHDGLCAVNPRIEINTDKLSKDAQERNAKRLRFVPKNTKNWIVFGAIWFFIGVVAQVTLLLAFAPRS